MQTDRETPKAPCGETLYTRLTMRDLPWPVDEASSRANVFSTIERIAAPDAIGIARFVVTKQPDGWRAAFGRLDVVSPAFLAPLPPNENLGAVRVLVEMMPLLDLVDRMRAGMNAEPFRIAREEIAGHSMAGRWIARWFPSSESPDRRAWPVFDYRSPTLPDRGAESNEVLAGEGDVAAYRGLDDVIRYISGFARYRGHEDSRRDVVNVLIWDRRGRIDGATVAPKRVTAFLRGPSTATVFMLADTLAGPRSSKAACAPVVHLDLAEDATSVRFVLRLAAEDIDEAWALSSSVIDCLPPMPEGRAKLKGLLDQLRQVDVSAWASVEQWIAAARPLVRETFPDHLDDFIRISELPERTATGEASLLETSARVRDNMAAFVASLLDLPSSASARAESVAAIDPLDRVVSVLERFSAVIRLLKRRSHDREALIVRDEYDVQYVLRALLAAQFDDVRSEEATPSCAGNASRIDLVIRNERIAIETKFARAGQAKKIADELIVDAKRYRAHPECGALVCFVYDPDGVIENAVALERDLSEEGTFRVVVVVRPR